MPKEKKAKKLTRFKGVEIAVGDDVAITFNLTKGTGWNTLKFIPTEEEQEAGYTKLNIHTHGCILLIGFTGTVESYGKDKIRLTDPNGDYDDMEIGKAQISTIEVAASTVVYDLMGLDEFIELRGDRMTIGCREVAKADVEKFYKEALAPWLGYEVIDD